MKFYLLTLLILGASCSFKKGHQDNQTLKGHEELYSEPEAPDLSKLAETERRIVIAATNDVHAKYEPQVVTFHDQTKKELSTVIGGKEIIKSYFSILRDTYKNVVLLDSGDIFGSGSDLKEVNNFYSELNYDGITVGLRDFNLKVPSKVGTNTQLFQNFAKESSVPLLISNLYELKTARVVEWPGTKPYLIKEVDGVKVGVIGLIPNDIVALTPVNNRVALFVENMLQSTLRHARLVRSLGAEIVVVLTHQGIDCNSELSNQLKLPLMKVNFDPHQTNICDLKNPLGEYLERLPPQLVDVVFAGRSHQKTANYVNSTLVLSGFEDGKSFSFAEFVVDLKTKKIVPEKTVVHQPVLFCHEFFKETKDCYTGDPTVDHERRTPATFLGKKIDNPGSSEKVSKAMPVKMDVQRGMNAFEADLSYLQENSGETQLVVLKFTGKELLKILEQDFNNGRKSRWHPSPFLVKNEVLHISITGEELEASKTYRILTDLEAAQKHHYLMKKISSYSTEAKMNYSWKTLDEDEVRTALAAPGPLPLADNR